MSEERVRSALETAGWRLTARGAAMGVAEFALERALSLTARLEPERSALYLTLRHADRSLTLKIPADDRLDEALRLLTTRQGHIDDDNYPQFVTDLVKLSPGTQGLRDGRLVDLEPG